MPTGVTLLDDPNIGDALFSPVADQGVLGLAVSGGADSLALMLLAQRWAKGCNVGLVVYSVDHGLRSEAGAEVAMVLAAAQGLGLTARGLVWDGPHPQTGVQEAARNARYALMGAAMAADGAKLLLTGHHLGDQAETILMRLAHGSGLDGLRGMTAFSTVARVRVFRPLLGVDPAQLRAVVAQAGLTPVQDPSNADRHYERVRWRQMLPHLAALGLDAKRLAEFGARQGKAQDAIAQAAEVAAADLISLTADGAEMADERFAALPVAVGVLVLSKLLAQIGQSHKTRAIGTVETLYQELVSAAPFAGRTLHGCMVRRDGATISVRREAGRRGQAGSIRTVERLQT